jgi:exodeoxyribonuclease-1
MSNHTFLWHDYETFGAVPRRDRPAQFAAIRTDAELNEIGEPVMLYCQPAPDYLPDPQACLITGITPQHCLEHGVPEHEFAKRVCEAFSEPGTIGVGYNTIRFDDEVTRFLFWRNMIDPYAREWQNGCGRWDLLDVVRMTYALRPDGISWPMKEDGKPSFRLEDLTRANGLVHEAAHDALSDVRATIAMARLIRSKQPKLFDFCLELRRKDKVASEMGLHLERSQRRPILHVSGMFPAERGCLGLVWPLASHPTNKNEVLVWDCRHDPSELFALSVDTIRERLFTRAAEMPEGMSRLPIKSVHLNKSPMLVGNLKTLDPALAAKWELDIEQCLAHARIAAGGPDMSAVWQKVFQREAAAGAGWTSTKTCTTASSRKATGASWNRCAAEQPARLAGRQPSFEDERLAQILFRYRCRNFPHTLQPNTKWKPGKRTARRACSRGPAARAASTSCLPRSMRCRRRRTSGPRRSWARCTTTRKSIAPQRY